LQVKLFYLYFHIRERWSNLPFVVWFWTLDKW